MQNSTDTIKALVIDALEELKAVDLTVLDVKGKSSFADIIILASGTSTRHVKSLAQNVVISCKAAGSQPLGVEGESEGEWVLVDLVDVVVNVMSQQAREFYQLDKLWSLDESDAESKESDEA